jgi:hypothetical protein
MDQIKAPCSVCVAVTYHNVLHSVYIDDELCQCAMIQCCGCGEISLKKEFEHPFDPEDPIIHYYPSPVSRRKPNWLSGLLFGDIPDIKLGQLMLEIYQAVAGGQLRLAAMGIRSLLEQMMVAKVGDQGSFIKNLDSFHQKGFISLVQRDAMSAILDAGHAVTHRSFEPKKEDLNTALDIAEGVFAAIYIHTEAATKIADRVPPRPKKS